MGIQRKKPKLRNLPILLPKSKHQQRKGAEMKARNGKVITPKKIVIERENTFIKCPKCANVQKTTAIYHTNCKNCKHTIRIDKWNTQTIHTGQTQ